MVHRLAIASAAGLLAVLSACSSDTSGAPAPTSAAPTTSSSASPTGPSAGSCPVGQYEITTISGKAGASVNGVPIVATSAGGLKLALTQDGRWTLSGDGATVTLEASGVSVDATVNGTAEGGYAKQGSDYLFNQEKATGKVTLKQAIAGVSSFAMDEVGPALAPSGKATLTCGTDSLKITSESVTLDLKSTGAGPANPTTPTTTGGSSGGGGALSIEDSAQTRTIDCAGRNVALNGSSNKLTFTGTCGTVAINGSKNELTLANVSQISVNGSLNKVTYSAGDPKISNNGTGNTVSRG